MTVSLLGLVKVEVVCLGCGEIYCRLIERDFAESKTARRVSGYLPICCNECKAEINERKEQLDG